MNPIDKFSNIDTVYLTFDAKEEDILDYVWQLAMLIHPATPKKVKGEILEGSEAMPTFKERYNNRLIKMPLTYEEYKKNKEIQPTLAGLEIDSDKFWFLLLFIWDYTQGQCFNAQELAPSPIGELNSLIKVLSQYKAVGENPLTDQMQFSEDITLSIQINGKEVQTIQHPNTISYLLSLCEKSFQSLCDMELEDMIAMCEVPLKDTSNTESNNKMPLTYEEYKKNKEIQPTLAGLEIDSDKFWFLLLFIWDYTQGQCFNAQELAPSPIGELNSLIKVLSQYKAVGENPLTDQMQFSEDITLSIQINGKEVQTIQHPNTISYLLSLCEKSFQSLCDMELEDMIAMCEVPLKDTSNTESNNSQICYFTLLFKSMLQPFPDGIMTKQKRRSRNSKISYNVTFLISRLIYLTGISKNEEFYVNERTLKGYLSNKSKLTKVRNRIY